MVSILTAGIQTVRYCTYGSHRLSMTRNENYNLYILQLKLFVVACLGPLTTTSGRGSRKGRDILLTTLPLYLHGLSQGNLYLYQLVCTLMS